MNINCDSLTVVVGLPTVLQHTASFPASLFSLKIFDMMQLFLFQQYAICIFLRDTLKIYFLMCLVSIKALNMKNFMNDNDVLYADNSMIVLAI